MLGVSYGQLLLLIGAVVAFTGTSIFLHVSLFVLFIHSTQYHPCIELNQLLGPKDFPRVSRLAGRMAGRAIGYVQLARGQFDVIMHQSQAQQVSPHFSNHRSPNSIRFCFLFLLVLYIAFPR